jgi:hypothetical protein
LGVIGVEVLNSDKQVMIGLEKLVVDVSFIGLLRKEYRVESIMIDGLKVNSVLMPDGKIDLLDLMPSEASLEPKPSSIPPPQVAAAYPKRLRPCRLLLLMSLS